MSFVPGLVRRSASGDPSLRSGYTKASICRRWGGRRRRPRRNAAAVYAERSEASPVDRRCHRLEERCVGMQLEIPRFARDKLTHLFEDVGEEGRFARVGAADEVDQGGTMRQLTTGGGMG